MAVFALQGTFLVRPGLSLAGCMVISAAVAGGGCKHMALDGTQLQSRSLEVSAPSKTLIPQTLNIVTALSPVALSQLKAMCTLHA